MTNPTPDQPTGMNELREILENFYIERDNEHDNEHEDIYGPPKVSEAQTKAEALIQQIVERCIGPDEPTTQSLLDDGPPYIDNPVAVRRNELRAELRHNLQQAGLLRGDELTQKPAKETEGQS